MASSNIVQLPTPQDIEEAKDSSRTLAKYADAERVKLRIEGSNNESDDLVLPGHVLQMLLDILSGMARGEAISIVPIHAELGTQEAASLLNVSRPFLVGLLDGGEIAHRKVGSHRRVLLKDVLEYKERIDADRAKSLDKLSALSQELGMGYD